MTTKDNSKIQATGEVHDFVRFVEDGEFTMPNGEVVKGKSGETVALPVNHNLIVFSFPKIISALMKGEETFFQNMWWEVGSGSNNWNDEDLPSPTLTDTALLNPTYRKKVTTNQINYLDPNTNEITPNFTNKIQVECIFSPTEANGYLREFAIFMGGNEVLGSGLPINRKIHGVIFKTKGIELQRKIHFQFNI